MTRNATRHGGPHEVLILAAVRRAVMHDASIPARGAPFWILCAHLGLPRRSGASRELRAGLEQLEARRLVSRSSRHGVPVWALTPEGEQTLAGLDRPPPLPESPQHLAWRRARDRAAVEIESFRDELEAMLAEASQLLEHERHATRAVHSDAWFELAARLRTCTRRLGSAAHIVREWPEPDDARADLDQLSGPGDELIGTDALTRRRAARAGRRNTHLWSAGR
jgi:hypothetical protein